MGDLLVNQLTGNVMLESRSVHFESARSVRPNFHGAIWEDLLRLKRSDHLKQSLLRNNFNLELSPTWNSLQWICLSCHLFFLSL